MKRKVLFALAFCGIIIWCVVFQIFIFKTVGNNVFNMFVKFEAVAHLKEFLKQAPALNEQLLLIDRNILKIYKEKGSQHGTISEESCVFCYVGRYQPITFAILVPSNISLEEHIVLPILQAWEIGFWVEQFTISHPKKYFPYHSHLPIGFILQKGGGSVVIEIVLLHDHEGDFWWHGSLVQDSAYAAKLQSLKLESIQSMLTLNHEGAYDKMTFKPQVLDGATVNVPQDTDALLRDTTRFIPCNHDQADRYHRKYGKDTSPKAIRFVHRARRLMNTVKTTLDQLKIPFWLSSGTLLGYFRQCSVIPYTTDVDIGIMIKDYNTSLITELKRRQINLKHRFGKLDDGFELSFNSNFNVKLDIFFFYENGNTVWNGGHKVVMAPGKPSYGLKFRYTFPSFTLCWTEWLSIKVRVPCETEEYIKANYGPEWFTPNPTWHWYKSPFNVQPAGTWKPEEVDLVLKTY